MTDIITYPLAIIGAVKHRHLQKKITFEKRGSIEEKMDQNLKRPVYLIRGKISSNNFIGFQSMNLSGQYLYIQMKLYASHTAILHIETLLKSNKNIRISLSNLYDRPAIVGSSIRLPFPKVHDWMILFVNLQSILIDYFSVIESIQAIKKIQFCSTMDVRDVLVSTEDITGRLDVRNSSTFFLSLHFISFIIFSVITS